ncbi:MAG TPA: hypothetical protein VEZ11_16055 [Thermoanaerobaculia bacterium]|nr:hypothetical protein [Thermoanaerobaculia bacterium]
MKRLIIPFSLVLLILGACKKKEEAPEPAPPAAPVVATVAPAPSTQPAGGALPATANLPANAPIPAQALQVWFSADAGVTTGTGDTVTKWTSQAGNGVIAEPPADQPRLQKTGIGGHPAIEFNGKDQMLRVNVDINPAKMPTMTVFAVFSSKTASTEPLRKLYGHDNGGYDRAAGLDSRGGAEKNYCMFLGDQGTVGYFKLEANQSYLTTDVFAPEWFSGWVNGKQALNKRQAKHGEGLPLLYLGGTGTVYQEYWNGDLAEFILYNRELPDAERTQVEQYLAKKYGIVLAP